MAALVGLLLLPDKVQAACPADAVFCVSGVGGNGPDGDDVVGEDGFPGIAGTPQVVIYGGPNINSVANNKDGIRVITTGGAGGEGGTSIIILNAGSGGTGGAGGNIDLTNAFAVSTNGSNANGIVAIADGGRGGDAGSAGLVGGGGDGGSGGGAGSILLNNTGQITTVGQESRGILAQANGGSAGNAGGAIIAGVSGIGGNPAAGGPVTVVNGGIISTTGARSDGILAQSIGGGGGAGASGGLAVVARVGGKSTGGHDGGAVTVTSTNNITTDGIDANGILAQSIGGAGGNAAGNVGLIAIGGNAAGGGNGNTVTVNAGGMITTRQAGSHGILAQSVGGGGGNGGFSVGVVSIGGDGGSGGVGGIVNVGQAAGAPPLVIDTTGDRSIGILAQSVGGGGGDGGMSFAAGPNIAIGAGGSGANGGFANAVTVNVGGPGSVTTRGRESVGILAQSIGGGGGNGGLAAAISLGSLAVGGQGGSGNHAGTVNLTSGLNVTTSGEKSHGLLAQSIGGGGGSGGAALSVAAGGTISVSVGGKGGAGGDGNIVTLNNTGNIKTQGEQSYAISAQSIGGGGGDGGFAFSLAGMGSPFSLAIGGDGNAAGAGQAVNVTSTGGNLETTRDNSHAVYAVSIGGGGGSGGIGGAGALTAAVGIGGKGNSGGNGGNVNVTLNDGAGETNFISTSGFKSSGIVARSVGGGGGDGGLAIGASFVAGLGVGGSGSQGGNAGTVTVVNNLDITTLGALSDGILAQSIGGGGGDGGTAVSLTAGVIVTSGVSIGGTGDGGGDASAVNVTNNANINVHGAGSKAIVAQAIGGGGGKGGEGFTLGATIGIPGLAPSASAKVTIGGSGGGGGAAADVTVRSTGSLTSDGGSTIDTAQDDRVVHGGGILAQSIGGGGGLGGSAVTKSFAAFSALDLALSIGGSGSVGGDGKAVTVETFHDASGNSTITTKGFNAVGVFAQSIGGGGGAGGRADTWQQTLFDGMTTPSLAAGVAIGGSSDDAAIGGTVTVRNNVHISTDGLFAHGIVAESVGGGGGIGGSANSFSDTSGGTGQTQLRAEVSVGGTAGGGGNGGKVDLSNAGNITTRRDYSVGMWAHSVGGGGGGGGSADADLLIGAGSSRSYAAAVAVGGSGGSGGNGGEVIVGNSGTINTGNGIGSVGLLAQSIGGGGGFGGAGRANISAAEEANLEGSIGVGIGGRGSIQGNGGLVTVTNSGTITTGGADAHAIVAQSIGGGGGVGGAGTAGTAGKYQIGGGFGATGGGDDQIAGGGTGSGDTVRVTNSGDLLTTGRQTFAILAQSIGGGGGAGGLGSTTGSTGDLGISAAIGGSGGSSGAGGEVFVTNRATLVRTTGDGSHAIVAQSIGGGGGAGGASTTKDAADYGIGAGLAGNGGASGSGRKVTVDNEAGAIILTEGSSAYGILAESVGGGGGVGGAGSRSSTGGDLNVGFIMGGGGGGSGAGGDVTVTNAGTIETLGALSHGIVAQSIGGGGGAGGGAKASVSADYNIGAGRGGTGGASGGSGAVSVTNRSTGRIITRGIGAHGILAQSIGGGGGVGGTAESGGGGSFDVSLNLGGGGGSAGNSGPDPLLGNAVTVINDGLIFTEKALSFGILAQSIGGGGGAGGGAIGAGSQETRIGGGLGGSGGATGNGGTVEVVNNGVIETRGDDSIGIFAQSVGGGGGVGGAATTNASGGGTNGVLSVGGAGAGGGNGGDVKVTVNGIIETFGARAHGIVAQSVGGGGGFGASAASNASAALAIGGSGANGGNGGDVTVTRNGQIITHGADSIAILAQSVGGGGGFGGSGVGRFNDIGVPISAFQNGGTGEGGIVTVTQNIGSDILTIGDRSHGIFVQGVGGGGGIGGFATLASNSAFAGSAGGFGNAKAVETTAMSDVRALGNSAYAVFGQSAAGQGIASTVTLKIEKVARATGANSVAIYGESSGNGGVGNINIDIKNNVVWGGSGPSGAGVLFVGGLDNLLTTDGTVTAVNNEAIAGGTGNERVENTRNVIGNVRLGSGTNAFFNKTAGLFITDDDIHLTSTSATPPPAANLLTNDGTLALGGIDVLKTTELWGNFLQTGTGRLPLDIDLNTQSTDRMNVTGTANVAGTGPLLFQSIDQMFTEYTIVSAQAGVTDNGFIPTMDPPAVGFNFKVRVEGAGDTDLVLFAEKPDFADLLENSGIRDPNVFRMAGGLTNIENALAIDDPFNRLINLLRFQPDEEALGLAIVSLTPSAAPHVFEFAKRRLTSFMDATDDCPELPLAAGFYGRRGCVWASGRYSEYEREDVLGAPTTDDEYRAFTIGANAPVTDALGLGIGFETGDGTSEKNRYGLHISETETDVTQASLSATYRDGAFAAGFSVAGTRNSFVTRRVVKIDGFQQTYTTYDGILDTQPSFIPDEQPIFTDRVRVFEGINGIAVGSSDLWAINPRLHFAYAFGSPALQAKPYVDIDAYFSQMDGYTEKGVGLANLGFANETQNLFSVTPGLELSTQGNYSATGWGRAYVRAGVMLNRSDEWEVRTQFTAAPEGLPDIRITEPFDAAVAKIDAGVQLMEISGAELSVEYSGEFSETTTQHDATGSVRFRY